MNFLALYDFIQNKMRMSHIYQPVMLITLLEHGGKASVRDIASSICSHDESQLEYYELITKNMVGKVLRNRNIVVKELAKENKLYSSKLFCFRGHDNKTSKG